MATKKILLVGESWVSAATHYKGFDQFGSVTFHSGAGPLIGCMEGTGFEIEHLPAHEAAERFPFEMEGLAGYDLILLSDIGANTLLLPPEVWIHSRRVPNRLKLLRDWTAKGGALMMAGGYLSFQGIDGRARWRRTAVEEALPITCLPYDDRVEIPEGAAVEIAAPSHPILKGMPEEWPTLLGVNEVAVREGGETLLRLSPEAGGFPLLVTGSYGKGRTCVWTSDIAPHWLPQDFVDWPGYRILMGNIFGWLTER